MSLASPFRRLRLLAGRGHAELAREAGISLTAMTNIEAGMYERVPVRANSALAIACREHGVDARTVLLAEYSAANLDAAMDHWKQWKRGQVDLSGVPPMRLDDLISTQFETPAKFARTLAVPTGVVDGRRDPSSPIPEVIREALADAHYRHGDSL